MVFLIILAIIILLLIYSVLPSYRKHPELNDLNGKFIAHRGFHNIEKGIPENSISALVEASARGYIIENDIWLTADGEVVVFHDATLTRMCGVNKKIADLTLAEIKQYRLLDTNEKIPTLKEFLGAVDGKVPILIEFKAIGANPKSLCEKADAILREYKGKYYIQSFNPLVLFWYRRYNKSVLRGQLAMVPKDKKIISHIASNFFMNFLAKPDFVSFDQAFPNRWSFKVQKLLGAYPIAWTYKNQEALDKTKNVFKAYIFENFTPK